MMKVKILLYLTRLCIFMQHQFREGAAYLESTVHDFIVPLAIVSCLHGNPQAV